MHTCTQAHSCGQVETAGDCYILSAGIMASHPTNGFLCTKEEVRRQGGIPCTELYYDANIKVFKRYLARTLGPGKVA